MLKPAKGYVVIKRENREGATVDPENKSNMLPPSDFFILNPGESGFRKGAEVLLQGSARLCPSKEKDIYVLDMNEIVATL